MARAVWEGAVAGWQTMVRALVGSVLAIGCVLVGLDWEDLRDAR